ncbi:MAG: aminopeptidase P family N-terminal domain-containing protein, partial [Chloroflexota bacterium]
MTNNRLEKLYKAMQASKLEAVAINPGPTLSYLTGLTFHLMERPVVMFFVPGKDPSIILPDLETPKLGNLSYKVQAFPYGELPSEWINSFKNSIQAMGIGNATIGVEPRA